MDRRKTPSRNTPSCADPPIFQCLVLAFEDFVRVPCCAIFLLATARLILTRHGCPILIPSRLKLKLKLGWVYDHAALSSTPPISADYAGPAVSLPKLKNLMLALNMIG